MQVPCPHSSSPAQGVAPPELLEIDDAAPAVEDAAPEPPDVPALPDAVPPPEPPELLVSPELLADALAAAVLLADAGAPLLLVEPATAADDAVAEAVEPTAICPRSQ